MKSKSLQPKVNPVPYHFAKYGDDFLVEGVGLDAATVEMIKAGLPGELRAKVFGWRNVSVLPDDKAVSDRMMFVGEVANV